jgi:hypothetical protein
MAGAMEGMAVPVAVRVEMKAVTEQEPEGLLHRQLQIFYHNL